MIRSFKSRETEKIFSRQKTNLVPADLGRIALRELRLLDQSFMATDMWVPAGHNGHGAANGRSGRYAIPLGDRWSICFEWRDGHAYDVDIVDGGCPHG